MLSKILSLMFGLLFYLVGGIRMLANSSAEMSASASGIYEGPVYRIDMLVNSAFSRMALRASERSDFLSLRIDD
jgi:hypothetical protein